MTLLEFFSKASSRAEDASAIWGFKDTKSSESSLSSMSVIQFVLLNLHRNLNSYFMSLESCSNQIGMPHLSTVNFPHKQFIEYLTHLFNVARGFASPIIPKSEQNVSNQVNSDIESIGRLRPLISSTVVLLRHIVSMHTSKCFDQYVNADLNAESDDEKQPQSSHLSVSFCAHLRKLELLGEQSYAQWLTEKNNVVQNSHQVN